MGDRRRRLEPPGQSDHVTLVSYVQRRALVGVRAELRNDVLADVGVVDVPQRGEALEPLVNVDLEAEVDVDGLCELRDRLLIDPREDDGLADLLNLLRRSGRKDGEELVLRQGNAG